MIMVNENNIFDKVMLITQFLMKSEVVDLTKNPKIYCERQNAKQG